MIEPSDLFLLRAEQTVTNFSAATSQNAKDRIERTGGKRSRQGTDRFATSR